MVELIFLIAVPDPALRRDRPRLPARQSDRGRIRDIGHPPRSPVQVAIPRSAGSGKRGSQRNLTEQLKWIRSSPECSW